MAEAQTTEPQRPKEIPRQQQNHEIGRVASNVLYRKMAGVEAELAGKNQQERAQILNADEGKAAIYMLSWLDKGGVSGSDLSQRGNPIKISINGEMMTVATLEGSDDESLICTVVSADGSTRIQHQSVPKSKVVQAQFIAEADTILGQFSGDERAVVELYIKSLEGGTDALPADGTPENQAINEIIKRAATSAGMLTSEDVIMATETAILNTAQREKILAAVEGKNLADAGILSEIIGENIVQQVQAANQEVSRLQEALKKEPANETLRQALKTVEAQEAILNKITEAIEGNAINDYFQNVDRGEIDINQAQQFIKDLREGNVSGMVDAIPGLKPDPSDTPEQTEAKKRQRAELTKLLGKGGIGIFALLALLFYGISKTTEGGFGTN